MIRRSRPEIKINPLIRSYAREKLIIYALRSLWKCQLCPIREKSNLLIRCPKISIKVFNSKTLSATTANKR
jgi:hypothetical protein